ncbi:MAG: methylenetetrahydrofolate reductase [NAD(P)H] [Actinobacteria bacterium]|uniref:methylenetetrahydrofolate reductase (NADH) n=1 Tax=freshwater metagenome TaxID=449393 RepID=A0A6J7P8P6_9ZZZZ|nr:methylenetetrahydrofolate reductase [NAD(P)H] [Actinomycetota bacterium]MSX80536.1 methylenetetrahydrofolate reductase [NAD(P)H] [Actinomycetota bacterium]
MARIADLLARGRTFSFEFFPPKTDYAQLTLGRTIAELESLSPGFVSVTYGAGGGTRARTHAVVEWVRKETHITPMAHLTCTAHSRAEISEILANYTDAGVENILALGGDPPAAGAEPGPSDYSYALDLVEHIASAGGFSIGVAAHPEMHPRSADRASDRRYLAEKLKRADFAITQFFFEADHYFRMVDELASLGVDKPIVPGIMPVTNKNQVKRMAELSGSVFPAWLAERIGDSGDEAEVARIGVEVATELCATLLEGGAPGLHFFTMNRSNATREIYGRLGLPTF